MTHSVSRHLRIAIDSYDQMIRRLIPGYDRMLDEAAAAVTALDPERVIDLGAGTGSLSERVLERAPGAIVELWDVDPAMLAQARVRLAPFGERTRLVERSFRDPLARCDAVMASLALHHVRVLEEKAALYRRIAAALRPGGVFVNADATIPGEPEAARAAYRAWADHQVASGIDEAQAWRHFEEWASEDRYFSVEEELAAMEGAGLRAECRYLGGPISVIAGARPA
jgi:tRNA (cmo5U34)-methyltransferase